MASSKKRKTSKLMGVRLQAFADESSEEEPDPNALAAELKERGQQAACSGDFPEARSLLGRAVRLMPGSADLHELHAQVLLELGRTWEAVRAASRAVELRPEWAEAHLALARAQLNLGEPSLAESSFERALELQPADAARVREELEETRALAARQRALGPGVRAVVGVGTDGSGPPDSAQGGASAHTEGAPRGEASPEG